MQTEAYLLDGVLGGRVLPIDEGLRRFAEIRVPYMVPGGRFSDVLYRRVWASVDGRVWAMSSLPGELWRSSVFLDRARLAADGSPPRKVDEFVDQLFVDADGGDPVVLARIEDSVEVGDAPPSDDEKSVIYSVMKQIVEDSLRVGLKKAFDEVLADGGDAEVSERAPRVARPKSARKVDFDG